MRYIYNLLLYLIVPFELIRLLWRSRKNPSYRFRIPERFGFFSIPPQYKHAIWIHAVSFGEAVVASSMIKKLKKTYSDIPIVFTTMTPTGSDKVKTTFKDTVFHVYVPYDLPYVVKCFLKKVKPRLTIIMETELWPNILHYCKQSGIPTIIANARLSPESTRYYRLFKRFTQNMLQKLTFVAAQSKIDFDRFEQLGMPTDRMKVFGNIKFDATLPENAQKGGQALREQIGRERPVWIAASTHGDENEMVLRAFDIVRKTFPNCLLLLILRHTEEAGLVSSLCKSSHYKSVTRSSQVPCTTDIDVLIGDTLGEMMTFYASADVAFVGGSLIPIGGHNILEPALLELPIITGQHMFHFTKIVEMFQQSDAMVIAQNVQELAQHVIQFLKDPQLCKAFGARAKTIVETNRGALEKHLQLIGELMI